MLHRTFLHPICTLSDHSLLTAVSCCKLCNCGRETGVNKFNVNNEQYRKRRYNYHGRYDKHGTSQKLLCDIVSKSENFAMSKQMFIKWAMLMYFMYKKILSITYIIKLFNSEGLMMNFQKRKNTWKASCIRAKEWRYVCFKYWNKSSYFISRNCILHFKTIRIEDSW